MDVSIPNPLLTLHKQAEAELQSYDRIEIVSTFGEPQAEYAAFRRSCALLDLPQRSVIRVTGKDRHEFLNNLLTNQTWDKATKTPIKPGAGVFAFLLNLRGRIVAEMNVLERDDATLLEMDARLVPLVATVLDKYLFAEKVKIEPQIGVLHEIALHGPGAAEIVRELTGADMSSLAPLGSTELDLAGVPATLFRDDICGVLGLHLLLPSDRAAEVWMRLVRHEPRPSASGDLQPARRPLRAVGWAAFNAVRIEAGRPLFGIDIEPAPPSLPGQKAEPETDARVPGLLPAETGRFDHAVSVTKGCYLGQEIVARMHARHVVARRLVGFRVREDALPIAGSQVLDDTGNPIGVVTSSTVSPVLSNVCIGLALLKKPHFEPGRIVQVPAEGALRSAEVVALPFVR
jgi:folate-binding protein YgfZ